jgi:hypothetical protein
MSTELIPCGQGCYGSLRRPPGRSQLALAWVLGVCLALPAVRAAAIEFPGPRNFNLPNPGLSTLAVRQPGQATDDLVVGLSTGRLVIYRYNGTSNILAFRQELILEGRLTVVAAWVGLPLTDRGVVVAGADPDRAYFVRINATFPYLQLAASVDLEEDPGTLAWFGDVNGGHAKLAVSLPGLDAIAVLAQEPAWRVATTLVVGDQPFSLAGADLDGDGIRELVAAQRGYLSGDLAVYDPGADGAGALRFGTIPGLTAGLVAAVDEDGDGIDELLVADRDQPRLVVVTDAGAGLEVRQELALTLPAESLCVWPRADGAPALMAANAARGSVEFASRSAGGWARQETYFPGCLPAGTAPAELDGDGLPDLVTVGGGDLALMFARSTGGFWGLPSLALDASPGDLVHGDFDGDGRVDVLVAPALGRELSLFASRDGGLAPVAIPQPLAFAPGRMVTLDLDADTPAELAVVDIVAGEIVILDRGPGDVLGEAGRLPVGDFPSFLGAGDIDGDGLTDLLALHADLSRVQLFFGSGGLSFSDPVTLTYDIATVRAALIDLNGDGLLDIVGVDGASRVWWCVNQEGRSFGPGQRLNAGTGAVLLATGDLDGDGDSDVVVGCRVDRSLVAFENPGTGVLTRRTGSTMLASEPFGVTIADLDQDGRGDVVVNLRDQGRLDIYLSINPWNQLYNLPLAGTPDVQALDVVDVDRDGVQDLVALDASLQLGVVHRNIDPTNVAVEPGGLAPECGPQGELVVRIETATIGPWSLDARGDDGWRSLAADGRAVAGTLRAGDGGWNLELGAGELAAWGPIRALRLRCEDPAGGTATHLATVPAACGGALGTDRPAWRTAPWPNPGNPVISARFVVPREGPVRVTICDLAGHRVAVLQDGPLAAGEHEVRWDGQGAGGRAAAGAYVLVVDAPGGRLARKLLLLK